MLSPHLKSFHDRVYVLTVPGASERQEKVLEQLGAGNFEFDYSVDKNTVTKEQLINDGVYDEDLAVRVDPRDRKMTLGHICCSIGHRMIYERFLDSGGQRALVFEDDIVRLGTSEDTIEVAIADIPNDAELIYWGWSGGRFRPPLGQLQQAIFHIKRVLGLYKLDHRMIRNLYMRRFNKYFDVASVNFLAHSYTITRSAAETLIKWNTPINLNADHALIHAALAGDLRAYVSRNQMFGQRSIDSTDPLESLTQKYY